MLLKLKKNFSTLINKKEFNKQNSELNKIINIYGLGKNKLKEIYNQLGLNLKKNFLTLNLIKQINKLTVLNKIDKKKEISIRKFTIEKLKNYKGIRHQLRYPVRGQRTHTNAKTRKKNNKIDKNFY